MKSFDIPECKTQFSFAARRLAVKSCTLWLAAMLLTGCVTTLDSPPQPVNLDKAENTHVQAGLGYLRQKDKESARRHFYKALKINSDSAGAYNGLALLYWMEKEPELADKDFRKALSIDPDMSQARTNYGSFLYSQGRYQDAAEQFERVARDYSYEGRHSALQNLGLTQLKQGKVDDAERTFKQVISVNARSAGAYLELADIYFQRQDFALAKQYLDQFGRLSRQSARSLWLGIRLERIFGNKDKEASYALALKNLHPYSEEYLQYKQSIR